MFASELLMELVCRLSCCHLGPTADGHCFFQGVSPPTWSLRNFTIYIYTYMDGDLMLSYPFFHVLFRFDLLQLYLQRWRRITWRTRLKRARKARGKVIKEKERTKEGQEGQRKSRSCKPIEAEASSGTFYPTTRTCRCWRIKVTECGAGMGEVPPSPSLPTRVRIHQKCDTSPTMWLLPPAWSHCKVLPCGRFSNQLDRFKRPS